MTTTACRMKRPVWSAGSLWADQSGREQSHSITGFPSGEPTVGSGSRMLLAQHSRVSSEFLPSEWYIRSQVRGETQFRATGYRTRPALGQIPRSHLMFRLALAFLLICSVAVPVRAQQTRVDSTWLSFDPASKTARFQLIAGLTGLNGALNFNGFRDGGLTFVIPLGWNAEIAFRNHDGMLPHSAEVISPQTPLPAQPVSPAIPRAFTLKLATGLPPQGADVMRFVAEPAG